MTLATHEFIRRFLMQVLPKGFHRIRHYGLLTNTSRAENIARARELLATAAPTIETAPGNAEADTCPCCGGRMLIIEGPSSAAQARATHPRRQSPSGSALDDHDRSVAISPHTRFSLAGRLCHANAEQNMPVSNQRDPSTAIPSLPLNHQLALLRVSHTINQVQAHCTRLRITSDPIKYP